MLESKITSIEDNTMTELRKDEYGQWIDDETDEVLYLDDTDRMASLNDYETYSYDVLPWDDNDNLEETEDE